MDFLSYFNRALSYRSAIAIVEPWEHVGYNPQSEPVCASVNVAYIAQKIIDLLSVHIISVADAFTRPRRDTATLAQKA
ncbi:hypothetical protein [cf. Phormidesmis sp. LEGE 11477]|uniref:hypothetical protein n=1 Tax=cf. Phormidesmis sp. LEGE 11477 TaxID=1828680 RepID=UPI001880DE02|nr:hypothetical protein [cf. Phormidesmis sp. LEGE 11477]MBE9061979.1 hypothetical protein [cf. Phormidesmis sp. LEGE 11477]